MKKVLIFILLFCSGIISKAQSADAVVGKWLNKDGDAHIQIYKKGNNYAGKLVWLKNPNDDAGKPKMDVNNPENSSKTRPVLGLEILKGFVFQESAWEDGSIYDPKSGKTYSCKLSLNTINQLNVRGFVGISIIGRTDVWSRVK